MADVATPPTADAPQGKQQIVKPEKPDDDKYKEDLAKAEKEHTAAQDKLVSRTSPCFFWQNVLADSTDSTLAGCATAMAAPCIPSDLVPCSPT
jgi:hypothetical protein